jgi:hypothetical protein
MKDYFIRFYEDHGLWAAEGVGADVRGYTTALAALDAWKYRLVELTLTDAIIKHDMNPSAPIDLARVDAFRSEIDSLKLALASEQQKNAGLINAIKKMKDKPVTVPVPDEEISL